MRDFADASDYTRCVDGYIETVDVPDLGVTIYVNEIGLPRRLPFNSRARFCSGTTCLQRGSRFSWATP